MRSDGAAIRAIDLESVSQGARRAAVSSAWLYRLIREGKLNAYLVGERLMLHKCDVDEFIAARKAS